MVLCFLVVPRVMASFAGLLGLLHLVLGSRNDGRNFLLVYFPKQFYCTGGLFSEQVSALLSVGSGLK